MAAPKNNTNRTGKVGIKYNLSIPRLQCNNCEAKDVCPLFKEDSTSCGFLRRIRKYKLDTIEDTQAIRKQLILDSLVQLTVNNAVKEKSGATDVLSMNFRKILMDQLKELERDMFTQSLKVNPEEKGSILRDLIKEIKKEKNDIIRKAE